MSITVTALPVAILISSTVTGLSASTGLSMKMQNFVRDAMSLKKSLDAISAAEFNSDEFEKRQIKARNKSLGAQVFTEQLKYIRVLTNLNYSEAMFAMKFMKGCKELRPGVFSFSNGLQVMWKIEGGSCSAIVSGCKNNKSLQENGESYFKELDRIVGRNVRVIDSYEYFYYNYHSNCNNLKTLIPKLQEVGAKSLYTSSENEILGQIDGQNIRCHRPNSDENFILEVEKRVNIVNIGVDDYSQSTKVFNDALKSLKIQTNIKPNELFTLLEKAEYGFYRGNGNTPLMSVNTTLNWFVEDGYYVAKFNGPSSDIMKREADELFKKMNIAAGRDLRFIDEKSKIVYTYNTNYADKVMLINTLTEHGASDITEDDGKISCRLFDMDMVYTREDNSHPYQLEVTKVTDAKECQGLINDLNEEYGLNVQEMTYNKIKERLEQENMHLADETVLDDNSIVLTIDI